MSFPVSPGVNFREIDLTATAELQNSTNGSIAGKFGWGPVNEVVRVANETELVARFGAPTDSNYIDFFCGQSFLQYSNALDVVRIGEESVSKNAHAGDSAVSISVLNNDDYLANTPSTVEVFARYPGVLGNALAVYTCGTANQYRYNLVPSNFTFTIGQTVAYSGVTPLADFLNVGDPLIVDGARYIVKSFTSTEITLNKIYTGTTSPTEVIREWQFANQFTGAPKTNWFHLVVVDTTGAFTKDPGSILEAYTVSTVSGAVNDDGSAAYVNDVLFQNSNFVLAGTLGFTFNSTDLTANSYIFADGVDSTGTLAEYIAGYDRYKNPEEVDASLLIGGDAVNSSGGVLAKYLIQNIAEVRKDAVVFLSPKLSSVTARGYEVSNIIEDRGLLGSSSYAAMDSNWKYIYDRYNNKYRWVPVNGDVAGTYARVDRELEPWYSGGGVTKGAIKGAIKLTFNPDQTARDQLYQANVNPIVSLPNQGPCVYGDRTLLVADTAFNRIPTRRLFIVLEKTISRYAANMLFEFNDEFTQRRFVSGIEPFLSEVQGLRGVSDFRIIADSTVNTPQVVQTNRFVGQIYVKPNYSINFIRLDFVAVNASTSFDEVVGQF